MAISHSHNIPEVRARMLSQMLTPALRAGGLELISIDLLKNPNAFRYDVYVRYSDYGNTLLVDGAAPYKIKYTPSGRLKSEKFEFDEEESIEDMAKTIAVALRMGK